MRTMRSVSGEDERQRAHAKTPIGEQHTKERDALSAARAFVRYLQSVLDAAITHTRESEGARTVQ
jgi:hypothetical protein